MRFRIAGLAIALLCAGGLAGAPAAQAAPDWTEIDSLPEQILDVDADRVLYMPTTGTSATLALKNRHTEQVTPITLGAGMNPWGAFLTPYGVVIATSEPPNVGALYEWRNGSLTRLGALSGLQLKVAGKYVFWGARSSTFAPLSLYRRDLETGTTVELATDGVSGGEHDAYDDWAGSDVAANGDVAMWRSDGIYRYRAGVTEKVGQAPDPDTNAFPGFPRTDGTNVVWRTWAYAQRGSIRGHGTVGFTLDSFTTASAYKEPAPDYDYRVNGGWVAFTRGAEGAEAVWTRSPAGVETAVSGPGGYEIAGLSTTGEVIYGTYDEGHNNQTAFLARPGEAPVEIGKTWDNQRSGRGFSNYVFKSGDHWYSIAFDSLRRLQLTDSPVDGSQTSIDSGPEGLDSDSSPTFEFSSSVAGATFQCRLDDGDWETCPSPKTFSSLADGRHALLVRSVAGGEVDPEPASQSWTIDATAPAVSLTSPPPGSTTADTTPHLEGAAGTAPGDSNQVTVRIHPGGSTAAAPVQEITVTRSGGTWSADAAALADGTYTAQARQSDGVGNVGLSDAVTFTIDTSPPPPVPPEARLGVSPNPVLTGDPVELDASSSSDPDGTIVRHEWDLDGDGSFERDTGAAASTTTTYPFRGDVSPAVRVTDNGGNTAVASAALSVRQAPPPGLAGVSINDGARFTNNRRVSVRVVWPAFAIDVLLANDGGFDPATAFPVEAHVPWRIQSSGSERLPRTIYARFTGVDAGRETYQDDIILDRTDPLVTVAELALPPSRSARRASKRTYRLHIRGRDAVSGLKHMQVTTNPKKPGAVLGYRTVMRFESRSSKIFVRVRDRAKNWSRWKRFQR